VAAAEAKAVPASDGELTDAVARAYFKLLAIKDEYEVARLYTDGRFERAIRETFEAGGTIKFHLSPPLLGQKDAATGLPIKKEFGPWVFKLFKLLAAAKGLRGTPFDIFSKTAERARERQDIADYEALVDEILRALTPANHAAAVELAELPLHLRGFGHIKDRARAEMLKKQAALMTRFQGGDGGTALAAE